MSIKTEDVVCGNGMPAVVAYPADASGKLPVVVLMHERYGLVQHTKDQAARCARDGYVVIAPNFFFRHPDQVVLNKGDSRYDLTDTESNELMAAALATIAKNPQADMGRVAIAGYNTLIDSQPWYGSPPIYEYDTEGALALLEEAGCMPCKVKIGISTSGSGQMQPLPMNELVKEQLEDAGFEVELVPMDWNALINVFFSGAEKSGFDGINFSMAPIDASQGILKKWMNAYAPPSCCNWGFYTNPEVEALGAAALAEFDEAKRNEILTKMNDTIMADAPELFIVHDLNPRALSPKLSGFVQAQSWFQDLTRVSIK